MSPRQPKPGKPPARRPARAKPERAAPAKPAEKQVQQEPPQREPSESVKRLRAMHSHGAASVVGRMRANDRVAPEEVSALQKLETTIDLREQVERIRELTTDEGTQAEAGGAAPTRGQSRKAPAPRTRSSRRKTSRAT